jgi:two-component system, sensor histidine kinase ChiS
MSHSPVDPRWPKVLSLAVHEFRTPLTVVGGYIRMLLKERAGPVPEQQRRLLEEAEKSCARLSALLVEVSDLSGLEAGTATLNRLDIDLHTVLTETVAALPELRDRPVTIDLRLLPGAARFAGDPTRLRTALSSIILALRRELVTGTTLCVREFERPFEGRPASWLAIGAPEHFPALLETGDDGLATFDEWRGGCGMSLGVARRIIEAHGGQIWSPLVADKAGAILALPTS